MFTGNENQNITLEDASVLTENYRNQFGAATDYVKGEYFNKDGLQEILDQTDCVGIRIYYGLKSDQSTCLVLVGVLENGDDIYNGVILQNGFKCPPSCSTNNPLNS